MVCVLVCRWLAGWLVFLLFLFTAIFSSLSVFGVVFSFVLSFVRRTHMQFTTGTHIEREMGKKHTTVMSLSSRAIRTRLCACVFVQTYQHVWEKKMCIRAACSMPWDGKWKRPHQMDRLAHCANDKTRQLLGQQTFTSKSKPTKMKRKEKKQHAHTHTLTHTQIRQNHMMQ